MPDDCHVDNDPGSIIIIIGMLYKKIKEEIPKILLKFESGGNIPSLQTNEKSQYLC